MIIHASQKCRSPSSLSTRYHLLEAIIAEDYDRGQTKRTIPIQMVVC